MARGVEVVAPLPKISFVKVEDDTFSKPVGVADNTVRGFGCECISFMLWANSGRSHAFPPQIMMVLNSRDRSITFDTAVDRLFARCPEFYQHLF